jgi:preprotein translocase subunit SecG
VRWPATETLQRAKLTLEVLFLVVLLGLLLYVSSKDHTRAALFGLAHK